MKNIFLCSSFKDVASIFEEFIGLGNDGKRVTFIPTGSLTEKVTFYVKAGKKALEKMGLIVDELEISTATSDEIKQKLQTNDFIYVTGGNTFFLLQEMKKSGADKIITEEILKGKTYIGESAGSMILSPNIEYVTKMDSTKEAPELQSFSALNVIDFCPVPHYTNFPFVKAVEKIIVTYGDTLDLYPITNSQAICIRGEKIEVKSK
ncbi:peptidase E [Capnocytophaga sp.]|uniref:peptidase E n=1 Tax=Capnocytophaga sp. TaxID=44737 RepID=UPI0026DB8E8A|nr:Type 1 glutamine amidotransferase-like domain-containing protein [Capnocytophaga sp.]MDO5104996.1 Type 1 glutamine amidotransferase-like domain-containing protein [Capnocytophaga sp.]